MNVPAPYIIETVTADTDTLPTLDRVALELFKGIEPVRSERCGGSPSGAWEQIVSVYRNERGEWLGSIVARWCWEVSPERIYTIPEGPRKGQGVNHYWPSGLRRASVTVSLSHRHPAYVQQ